MSVAGAATSTGRRGRSGDVPADPLEEGVFEAYRRKFTDTRWQKSYIPTHEEEVPSKPGTGGELPKNKEGKSAGLRPQDARPVAGSRTAEELAHTTARDLGKVISVPKGATLIRAVDDMGREGYTLYLRHFYGPEKAEDFNASALSRTALRDAGAHLGGGEGVGAGGQESALAAWAKAQGVFLDKLPDRWRLDVKFQ